jgi:SAM-dependent methyltransferase
LICGGQAVVADALALPFRDGTFDLIGCSLFAHHLDPESLRLFADESLRVCSCAVLINDLVRDPLHLALVYAGFPGRNLETFPHFLYRMGVILWK